MFSVFQVFPGRWTLNSSWGWGCRNKWSKRIIFHALHRWAQLCTSLYYLFLQEHSVLNMCSPDNCVPFSCKLAFSNILSQVIVSQDFYLALIALCTFGAFLYLSRVILNLNCVLPCVWSIPSYSSPTNSIFQILLPKSPMRILSHQEICWISFWACLHFDSKAQWLSPSGILTTFTQNLHFPYFIYFSLCCG